MRRSLVTALLAVLVIYPSDAGLHAQPFQLAPRTPTGHIVPPWFEGWYQNPDGTRTYSFGFINLNQRDTLEVPLGEDNFMEPEQFDGMQPTVFPPGRHAGVFAVTVPAEYDGDVVWHLRTQGQANSVPGRATSPAYELGHLPMAMGSLPPLLWFEPGASPGKGPLGTTGPALEARVEMPVQLGVFVRDESVRERHASVGISWYKHQGPGKVTLSEAAEAPDPSGHATVLATFSAPGEYVVRVRADNFRAPDSLQADQCCWTNGYVRVTVR